MLAEIDVEALGSLPANTCRPWPSECTAAAVNLAA